jgi:hypothetical protein
MDTLRGTMPDHPALTSALITYIGNKRALLPFVWQGMERITAQIGPIRSMADPFAGSGVVARLGRLAGIEVHAGDVEAYTRPFGTAFLETSPAEVESLFATGGGYRETLARLNALSAPTDPGAEYFARHYAPADTSTADPERERLFYTRENALRIDAMLEAIHGEWETAQGEYHEGSHRHDAARRRRGHPAGKPPRGDECPQQHLRGDEGLSPRLGRTRWRRPRSDHGSGGAGAAPFHRWTRRLHADQHGGRAPRHRTTRAVRTARPPPRHRLRRGCADRPGGPA